MPSPHRRAPALLVALLLLAAAWAQPDLAPRALEADELDAATVQAAAVRFEIDTIVHDVLNATGVPGIVVALAWGGEVIAAEAYGTADMATGRALTLDDPLWVASVTKTPVGIAALALATQGRLDLDAPLETLLAPGLVPPPPTGDATPLTPRHLLSHTGGFDGRLLNTIRPDAGPNPALAELALPNRIEPAGSGPRYGNAGHHALGMLLEAVTGTDVETALQELVFAPLGMTSARLLRPTDAAFDAATVPGHARTAQGQLRPAAPLTLLDPTAGQLRVSGSDMARLLANLTAASPPAPLADGVREALLTTAARAHPGVPGTTLGMWEAHLLGHEVVLQGGDLPGLASLLLILPDTGVALFVHVNGPAADGGAWSTADGMLDVRWLLAERLVERFVGDARVPVEVVAADRLPEATRAASGTYRPTSIARTGPEPLLLLGGLAQLRVTVAADGSATVWTPPDVSPPRRYLPTEAGVYRREGGGDVLGASRGPRGEPLLHGELGMPVSLARVPPLERLEWLIGSAIAALLAALVTLLAWPLGAWRRWRAREPRGHEPGRALVALRWTARVQALATLGFVAVVLLMIDAAQPALAIDLGAWWPASTAMWVLLSVAALTLTVVGAGLALRAEDRASAAPRLRPRAAFHALLGLIGLALALQGWVWRLPPWG
jgi:CubicO group peptidase (beta-lactamase class C family)